MRLLALDTSSSSCSIALLDTEVPSHEQICHDEVVAPMQHGRLILPMIQKMLASRSLTVHDLNGIVYGCGPGAFTGVRIACSIAQGFGLSTHCRLIPISSLAILAETAYIMHKQTHCLVASDARVNEVYWAVYYVNQYGHVELQDSEVRCKPDVIPKPAMNAHWCGIGDGWGKYSDSLISRLGFQPDTLYTELLPKAAHALLLGRAKYDRQEWVEIPDAVPVYLG